MVTLVRCENLRCDIYCTLYSVFRLAITFKDKRLRNHIKVKKLQRKKSKFILKCLTRKKFKYKVVMKSLLRKRRLIMMEVGREWVRERERRSTSLWHHCGTHEAMLSPVKVKSSTNCIHYSEGIWGPNTGKLVT